MYPLNPAEDSGCPAEVINGRGVNYGPHKEARLPHGARRGPISRAQLRMLDMSLPVVATQQPWLALLFPPQSAAVRGFSPAVYRPWMQPLAYAASQRSDVFGWDSKCPDASTSW